MLEIVPEEFGLMMPSPPGLQPFRPWPSTERFLAPLLLDVIMEEKFTEISDIDRQMYLGGRVPGANGEERYGGTLPLASFTLSLSIFHKFTHGTRTVQIDVEHLGLKRNGCLFKLHIGYQYLGIGQISARALSVMAFSSRVNYNSSTL